MAPKPKLRIKSTHIERDRFTVRLNDFEKSALQSKANDYTEGNVSRWLRHAGLNYTPPRDALEKVDG